MCQVRDDMIDMAVVQWKELVCHVVIIFLLSCSVALLVTRVIEIYFICEPFYISLDYNLISIVLVSSILTGVPGSDASSSLMIRY